MRALGGIRSANADISNDKQSERLCRREYKGSCVKLIFAGLAGPKTRTKVVVDGNQVNIPEPGGSDGSCKLLTLIGLSWL